MKTTDPLPVSSASGAQRIMNMTFLKPVAVLILVMLMLCAGNAWAGMLEETCSLVYKKLSAGPYESLTKSTESFVDDGKHYHGCVIHLSGNINKITDSQHPDGLFGHSLPYCPDGTLPPGLPRSFANKEGWCADKMAGGPDGTSYRALKKNVFCEVEGRWDGGDDTDPTYVPSPRYEVIVKCANK